jgi:hypothetical protein
MPGARPGRTYLFAFGLILLAAVAVGQTMYDIWAQDGPYTRKTDLKATAPGATTPTLTLGGVRVPTVSGFKAGTGVSVSTSGGDVTYSSTASTGDYLTSASVTATSPITATPGAGTVAVGFDAAWPPVQGYITTGTLTGGWPVSVAVGGNNEALIGLDPAFSTIISDVLVPSGLYSEAPIEIATSTAEATFTLSDAANTSIGLAHAQNTDTGSSAATFTVNDLAADNATVSGQVNAFYVGTTNSIQTSGTVAAGDDVEVGDDIRVTDSITATGHIVSGQQVRAPYLGSSGDVQATGTVTAGTLSAPTISGTNASVANLTATEQVKAMYLGSSGEIQSSGSLTVLGAANGHGAANTGSYAHEFTGAIGLMDASASVTNPSGSIVVDAFSNLNLVTQDGPLNLIPYNGLGYGAESTQIYWHEFRGSIGLMDEPAIITGAGAINFTPTAASFTVGDGGSTNYTAINATGHQTMAGAATVWDDVTIPGFDVRVAGVSDPAWAKFKTNGAGSTGVFLWWFDPGTIQQVYFTVQLPHKWKEGSAIKPHVHWTPEVTADGAPANQTVEWGLEYTKASIGGTYGNTTLVYAKAHAPADANVIAGKHYTTDFADITMSGNTISTILVCRLFRNATDATDDTYEHDAGFLAFDIHIECDSIGSNTSSAK